MFRHLVRGDGDSADKHREFYDEYLAVMDLTAEFFLQTVDTVFVRHRLAARADDGTAVGRVDLSQDPRAALMTIEGEKDDITGIGQCRAALDLCSSHPRSEQDAFRMSQRRPLRHLQRFAFPQPDRAAHCAIRAYVRSAL